eukprot:TRINITY_DN102534_c0_g1_i1.p1 TRINITY_DN102534_c0_g1~~TRINITY_DN102534_c0_g1_i1.p1  ORF type:complete len:164 (+),score=55.11 TRINITY_DN102534_c0_g1_i1:98-589(+)
MSNQARFEVFDEYMESNARVFLEAMVEHLLTDMPRPVEPHMFSFLEDRYKEENPKFEELQLIKGELDMLTFKRNSLLRELHICKERARRRAERDAEEQAAGAVPAASDVGARLADVAEEQPNAGAGGGEASDKEVALAGGYPVTGSTSGADAAPAASQEGASA